MNRQPNPSKRPWLAVALNVILPGAGLAYLGKWRLAAINFGVAVIVPVTVLLFGPEEIVEHIHYLYLAIAVGSGAWAHATCVEDA